MKIPFAAVHESALGTSPTCRDVRDVVAIGGLSGLNTGIEIR
jgi:hypothetical protein